jgi:hypothetical protein
MMVSAKARVWKQMSAELVMTEAMAMNTNTDCHVPMSCHMGNAKRSSPIRRLAEPEPLMLIW